MAYAINICGGRHKLLWCPPQSLVAPAKIPYAFSLSFFLVFLNLWQRYKIKGENPNYSCPFFISHNKRHGKNRQTCLMCASCVPQGFKTHLFDWSSIREGCRKIRVGYCGIRAVLGVPRAPFPWFSSSILSFFQFFWKKLPLRLVST